MIENRLLRLLVALTAGVVMGLVSSFVSYRASAAPLHSGGRPTSILAPAR